ncbi:AbrB/MazE/SpoVT family DNA-binding domain-containing protein [Candidatus Pacearchaeota archaeon]|nr:AbrB/MazE/SpoVT family DNA-binding domain-containing protein [Candidatus Pacearchaeota archaeon]
MIIRREIGEKGQVVIPKDIREHLGLNIGVNIIFEVRDNEVVLKKEDDASKIVEDFFNTPKIKRKIDVKELKKIYKEQYEEEVH